MKTTVKLSRDHFTVTTKVKTTTLRQWFNEVKDNHGDGIVRRHKLTETEWDKLLQYLKEDIELYNNNIAEQMYIQEIMNDWIDMNLTKG